MEAGAENSKLLLGRKLDGAAEVGPGRVDQPSLRIASLLAALQSAVPEADCRLHRKVTMKSCHFPRRKCKGKQNVLNAPFL